MLIFENIKIFSRYFPSQLNQAIITRKPSVNENSTGLDDVSYSFINTVFLYFSSAALQSVGLVYFYQRVPVQAEMMSCGLNHVLKAAIWRKRLK